MRYGNRWYNARQTIAEQFVEAVQGRIWQWSGTRGLSTPWPDSKLFAARPILFATERIQGCPQRCIRTPRTHLPMPSSIRRGLAVSVRACHLAPRFGGKGHLRTPQRSWSGPFSTAASTKMFTLGRFNACRPVTSLTCPTRSPTIRLHRQCRDYVRRREGAAQTSAPPTRQTESSLRRFNLLSMYRDFVADGARAALDEIFASP